MADKTSEDSSSPVLLSSSTTGTFYFAYGSNLSHTQMSIRCQNDPKSSEPCAVARLDNYEWILCERGYANVVAVPPTSPSTTTDTTRPTASSNKATVYGLLYNLSPADEARLDLYEGHNYVRNPNPTPNTDPATSTQRPHLQGEWDYNKLYLPVTITKWLVDPATYGLQSAPSPTEVTTLVYIDEQRLTRGTINEEYIGRMNRGIRESVALGLPQEWVDAVMRGDIPTDIEVDDDRYVGVVEGYIEGSRAKWKGR